MFLASIRKSEYEYDYVENKTVANVIIPIIGGVSSILLINKIAKFPSNTFSYYANEFGVKLMELSLSQEQLDVFGASFENKLKINIILCSILLCFTVAVTVGLLISINREPSQIINKNEVTLHGVNGYIERR